MNSRKSLTSDLPAHRSQLSSTNSGRRSRRTFIAGAAAVLLTPRALLSLSHTEFGLVNPPLKVPDFPVVCSDGSSRTLAGILHRRVTAIQLMFTACTTTCPIQGTIFHHVQKLLPDQASRGIQLLSLSVDPQTDGPVVLQSWLNHFKPEPGWIAAAPNPANLELMRAFFGVGKSAADNHTTEVSLVNRDGLLVFKTGDLPNPEVIANTLTKIP
jgi:protein SCO1/2